jgi:proteasome lid subunit RPN8/RPN11
VIVSTITFGIDVIVPKIIELGMAKIPNEACGVVVPNLDQPAEAWVHELRNLSEDPLNSYAIDTNTIRHLLYDMQTWADVLIWHTHPSGHVGPSKRDWEGRVEGLRYLVVALPKGEATLF